MSRKSWLIGGQSVLAASQGLTLVIIARFDGAHSVGLYSLALALVSPVFLLGQLRLQDVLATDHRADDHLVQYLRLTIVGAFGALIVSTLLSAIWSSHQLVYVALAMAVGKMAESFSFLTYGYLQGQGRFRRLAISMGIRGTLGCGALALSYVSGGSLAEGVLAMTLVWGLVAILVDTPTVLAIALGRPLWSRHKVSWPIASDLVLARRLLPLGVATFLIALNQTLVRLVVEVRIGLSALGVFAAVAYTVRVGVIAVRSIAQSLSPELRQAASDGDRVETWHLCAHAASRSALFSVALSALILIAGPFIYPALLGEDFAPSRTLLAAVMLAASALFVSMPFSMGLVSLGLHKEQMFLLVATLALSSSAAFVLSGSLGTTGAALGWATGEACRAVGLTHIMRRHASPVKKVA